MDVTRNRVHPRRHEDEARMSLPLPLLESHGGIQSNKDASCVLFALSLEEVQETLSNRNHTCQVRFPCRSTPNTRQVARTRENQSKVVSAPGFPATEMSVQKLLKALLSNTLIQM